MMRWFFGRPWLGGAVGFLLYFGLAGDVFPEGVARAVYRGSVLGLAFYMIVAGLFAKTILDLFLGLAKKVFRV